MKIIFNIYKVPIIIEQNKNSYNAKKFQASGFSECPIFFGQEWKKNIYNFPKQAKISKIAQKFSKHLRKKNVMNISEHRICWTPKFLGKNEKKWTYIIYLKYIKQNTDSHTTEYFSSIFRNVFQEFFRMPNFKPKIKY